MQGQEKNELSDFITPSNIQSYHGTVRTGHQGLVLRCQCIHFWDSPIPSHYLDPQSHIEPLFSEDLSIQSSVLADKLWSSNWHCAIRLHCATNHFIHQPIPQVRSQHFFLMHVSFERNSLDRSEVNEL